MQLPNVSETGPEGLFEGVAGLALRAEASGFDSVWVMDDSALPGSGGPDRPALEAYTLLGALAVRTERVQLGAMLRDVTYRNPGIVAKMVTTLDVISHGRAMVGFGGAARHPDQHLGRSRGHLDGPVALDMLEEAVQVCRALFTGDDVSFTGTHFRLDHARNRPRPVRPGGPRMLIGGDGGPGTLHVVAQYADKCNLTGDAATVARAVEALHRRCAEIGRDPVEIDITWMAPLVLTTSDQHTREVSERLQAGVNGQGGDGVIVGQPHQVPDLIAGHVAAGVDEVYFSLPSLGVPDADADAGGIGEVGRSLGLVGGSTHQSGIMPR